jgi:hypothetical protein
VTASRPHSTLTDKQRRWLERHHDDGRAILTVIDSIEEQLETVTIERDLGRKFREDDGEKIRRLEEQYQALHEAAQRVVEREASGQPQEWAMVALARVVSNPATSSERSSAADTAVAGDDPADRSEASSPATEASERGTSAGSDGTDSGTPDDGSAERLSRPATPRSEASAPASSREDA